MVVVASVVVVEAVEAVVLLAVVPALAALPNSRARGRLLIDLFGGCNVYAGFTTIYLRFILGHHLYIHILRVPQQKDTYVHYYIDSLMGYTGYTTRYYITKVDYGIGKYASNVL